MLKIKAAPTFKQKVKLTVQGGEQHEIEVEFRHKRKDDADDHFKGDRPLADKLADIIVGWSGVETEFSLDALRDLDQEYPSIGPQLMSAYVDGLVFGRVGN